MSFDLGLASIYILIDFQPKCYSKDYAHLMLLYRYCSTRNSLKEESALSVLEICFNINKN